MADGSIKDLDMVSSVELRFKNRATNCRTMVLPGDTEPHLGCIPLEDMVVVIYPLRQEIQVNQAYPYFAQMKI